MERKMIIKEKWFVIVGTVFLLILLSVAFVGVYNTYKAESEEMKRLEQENTELSVKLSEKAAMVATYRDVVDSLTSQWRASDVKRLESDINKKYETKKDFMYSQPIDSTIRDLSKWVR